MMTAAYAGLPRTKEVVALRDRHRDYYVALAETAELYGPNAPRWRDVIEDEADNIRMAIGWSLETDPEAALRILAALQGNVMSMVDEPGLVERIDTSTRTASPELRVPFLLTAVTAQQNHGDLARAEQLAAEALELARSVSPLVEARALAAHATVRMYRSGFGYSPEPEVARDFARAHEIACGEGNRVGEAWGLYWLNRPQEALSIFRELEDDFSIAWAAWFAGLQLAQAGDLAAARGLMREAVGAARASHSGYTEAWVLAGAGDVELIAGDNEAAQRHYLDAVATSRRRGVGALAARALTSLARCAMNLGDAPGAERWLREAVREAEAAGRSATGALVSAIEGLATAASADRPERTARLFGATAALSESLGRTPTTSYADMDAAHPRFGFRPVIEAVKTAREALGDDAYEAACAAGAALSRDELVREALAAG